MNVLIATGNKGKLREIRHALEGTPYKVLGLDDLDATMDVEETSATFAGNAQLKAAAFGRMSGFITLADDSGLCVDALKGAPGVYSARYSGEGATAEKNNTKLLRALSAHAKPWTAHFHCAMALWLPPGAAQPQIKGVEYTTVGDDHFAMSSGKSHGKIIEAAAGADGFGYDPIFLSDDLQITFAQASKEEKLKVSHRGRALSPVLELLRTLAASH